MKKSATKSPGRKQNALCCREMRRRLSLLHPFQRPDSFAQIMWFSTLKRLHHDFDIRCQAMTTEQVKTSGGF